MKDWNDLDYTDRLSLHLNASTNPVFFAENEYFLNLSLWPMQKKTLTDFYSNHPPINELILIWGMRSSKTFMASLIACYEIYKLHRFEDPAVHYGLAPGSEIFLINVATGEDQARDTIFAQEKAKIDHSPWFQSLKYRERTNEFRFPEKNIVVRAGGCNSASLVGKTDKVVLFDELSRFKTEGGRMSGKMVYDSLGRGTATFGEEGIKVVISSILTEKDLIIELYNQAQYIPSMMASRAPTWEINPNITRESLESEFQKDHRAAGRDFANIPWIGGSTYFNNTEILRPDLKLDNIITSGGITDGFSSVVVNNESRTAQATMNHTCIITGDPAVQRDGFGLAMGYFDWNKNKIIIPLAYRFEPKLGEIDPLEIKRIILMLCNTYPVYEVVFDTWNYPETCQEIEQKGIPVTQHTVRLEDYERVKDLLFEDMVDIVDYPPLWREMENLVLKRLKVDHQPGFSKDISDAVCNVCWAFSEDRDDEPLNLPRIVIPLGAVKGYRNVPRLNPRW